MPPNQTILGVEFFEIEYLSLIQHIFPLILLCRNVTLRSNYTIDLSFIITAFNSLLYYFHQAFFIQGITLIDRIRECKFYGHKISDQSQTTQPNHTVKYIENFTISFQAYQSLLRVCYQIA